MTKKKTMKNIKTPNKFEGGGQSLKELFSKDNLIKGLPGIAGTVGGVTGGLISNGFSTAGGQVLSGIGDAAMMFNPIVGGAIKAASGLVNRGFGTKWNQEGLAKAKGQIEGLNNFQSGASDYDTLAQDFTRIGSMSKTIKASDLGKDGWFVNRTTNKANELNTDLGNAYNFAMRNANNVVDNIAGSTLANLERNYAAFGGPIDTVYVNSRPANFVSRLKDKNRRYIRDWEDPRFIATHKLGAEYDENGIPFIYPAVQEINGQLIDFTRPPYTFEAGIESAIRNRDTVQMRSLEDAINFTEKYKDYYPKFAYGGQTHGSDFTNGLMFINNGGTHESNPYEGVPISMDQEGNPNLVEEGEIIWNDYVFSNRLKVPKSVQKKYKLGKREMTFANAIDKLSKESEERPNDPISMRGLEDILMHMAIEQETIKGKKQNKKVENNKFAIGGPTSGMSWFQDPNGKYYQEYLDAVKALTKQQYIDYIKRSTGQDTAYTDQEFEAIKAGMIDGEYGQKHIDMYNIMQAQPLKVSNANLESLTSPVKPLNVEELKLVNTGKKPATLNIPVIDNHPTWMRYAPAIGYGALALTDAFGITNKPDYSNAEAIIKASNNLSSNPIKFKPIGDYLTYNPFDTEYHANQLRAISGATRRNIMNTSRGNRAAALTGILAADNNTMNQMGDLYRKAAEYNLEQRQKVADFNRTTNTTNSEGFLEADMANQSMKQAGLEGLIRGYAMKEQANLTSDQAKAANISGLLTSLGNIGYENVNRNMMNWGMATGIWAPSQWKYDPITGKLINE